MDVSVEEGGVPMSKWLLTALRWLSEAWELRSHSGRTRQARGWVAECQRPVAVWLPPGDCRTVGLYPKDILTTTPPLGPEQAPFRPALTREPGEIPGQSIGLSKPCLRTKEVKATNTQQTSAWVWHEGPDAIQEFALRGRNRPGDEGPSCEASAH